MDKLDYKKAYRELYLPKAEPVEIDVPELPFFMVRGKGDPKGKDYQAALQALYALTFTIKMSKMSGNQPNGYFEYTVPPLEGIWWGLSKREEWNWVSMIRQPEFVTREVFHNALEECRRKKPEVKLDSVTFETWREGGCVQMMHFGPYAEEEASFTQMREFMKEHRLLQRKDPVPWHHEIYISNPQKIKNPARQRTVLRIPLEGQRCKNETQEKQCV